MGITFSDVGVKFAGGGVVPAFFVQRFGNTGVVARVRARGAVANLMPSPLSLLRAATTKEQVIINFVIGRGTISIKDGRRCSLETDNNC